MTTVIEEELTKMGSLALGIAERSKTEGKNAQPFAYAPLEYLVYCWGLSLLQKPMATRSQKS